MEKFIFAKSSDSSEYFPDNKDYDFKIHLDRSINLQGYWKVGITEFFTTASPTKTSMDKNSKPITIFNRKPVYVYTNICSFSSVHGQEQPLLRIIHADASYGWNDKFDSVYYFPVRVPEISDIHIYLKDDTGSPATFIDSDVWVTLHMHRYPF